MSIDRILRLIHLHQHVPIKNSFVFGLRICITDQINLLIRDAGDGRILGIAGHEFELWHDKLVKTLKYTCVTMNVTVLSLYLIMRTPEWFSPVRKLRLRQDHNCLSRVSSTRECVTTANNKSNLGLG